MASLYTLLDVETETEAVWKNLLSSAPYSLLATDTDTAAPATTPRVECISVVVRWGPHQITPSSGVSAGVALYDQFVVRTMISFVYQPERAHGHGVIRGIMRQALSDWTGIKNAFSVNGYLIPAPTTLQQVDGSRTIDDEEKTETIETVLELAVFLNPNAVDAAT